MQKQSEMTILPGTGLPRYLRGENTFLYSGFAFSFPNQPNFWLEKYDFFEEIIISQKFLLKILSSLLCLTALDVSWEIQSKLIPQTFSDTCC